MTFKNRQKRRVIRLKKISNVTKIFYKSNKKLLHFIGILQNENLDIAAIFETVLAHIDLNQRKVVNFADDKIKHLQNVYLEQRKMIDIPFDIKLHIKDIDE